MRRLEIGECGETFYRIREDKKIVAYLNYRDYSGRLRRVTVVSRTKKAARAALQIKVEQALAKTGVGVPSTLTFGMAADAWLASFREKVRKGTRSPASYDVYRCLYANRIAPVLSGLMIDDLKPSVIDAFLKEVWRDSYSAAKTCRTILSGVCGQLVINGMISHNYVRDAERLERGWRRAPRALSPAELGHWLTILDASPLAVRKDLPDLVRFLLGTGMRIGEALALTWAEVDLLAGVVIVEWNIARVTGQGLVRSRTKSDSSDRTLELSLWCGDLLRRRWTDGPMDRPVFASSTGTWRDRSNVGRDLRTIRAGTSVDWFVSHTARRTVATLLDAEGLTARSIADQLGHARPSMTQDIYMGRKVASPAAAKALEIVGSSLAEPFNATAHECSMSAVFEEPPTYGTVNPLPRR